MLRPTQLREFIFSLQAQKLDKWIAPYLILLSTFSGLEDVQEDTHSSPYQLICRIFEDASNKPANQIDPFLVEQFVHFPLFNWRARRKYARTLWNPLEQTLEEFKADGPAILFQDTTPYPDAQQVEKWLRRLLK